MKFKHKLILGFIISLILLVVNPTQVDAAGSFSVSGGGSGTSGASKTVTISASSCAGKFTISASGGGSVSSSSVFLDNSSSSITVTLPASGSTTVTVTASDVTDYDGVGVTGSKSVTYTVSSSSSGSDSSGSGSSGSGSSGSGSSGSGSSGSTSSGSDSSSSDTTTDVEEETKSTDNKLSSLSVSEGTLSPSFSAGTNSYSVSVLDVSSINISATASDSKATVSGTGTKELTMGSNSFSVVVTAENGSTNTYTINVNLDESPTVFVELGDKELGVVKNTSLAPTIENAVETTVTLNGEEVPAWNITNLDITVLYMIDADGNMGYYIYEGEEITSSFTQATILGRNVAILDVEEENQDRAGLIFQEVTIDEVTLFGWVFEDDAFEDYIIINVMNDEGEMVDYLYCVSENTMILSPNMATVTADTLEALYDELEVESAKLDSAESDYQALSVEYEEVKSYLMIAAGVTVLALIMMLIQLIISFRKKRYYQNLLEESVVEEEEGYLDEDIEEVGIEEVETPLLSAEEKVEIFDIDDDDIDMVISDWDNKEN